ncbi:MAG: hypothetical protein HY303_16590, partial [Candidatus Wallbacteria bacterium]|nr:hypothetical protein [Candidatus Wallbacteria bacterium]
MNRVFFIWMVLLGLSRTALFGQPLVVGVAGAAVAGSFDSDNGTLGAARLDFPIDVAIDGTGTLFVCDQNNHRIRRLDLREGLAVTVAGSGPAGAANGGFSGDGGPAVQARLRGPRSVALDAAGNLYICDSGNHRVRRVDARTGIISSIAG